LPSPTFSDNSKPEANGDYLVELSMPDGTVTTASVSLDIARVIVAVLQPAIVEEAVGRAQNMILLGFG